MLIDWLGGGVGKITECWLNDWLHDWLQGGDGKITECWMINYKMVY